MWLLVRDIDPGLIEIFFNSGDAVTQIYSLNDPNGIGLDRWTGFTFMQNGQYIGVSLSTTSTNYEMYMDQTLFTVGQWVNLGFTWSEAEGLRLFINGQDTGLTQTGASAITSSSATLSHGRAIIGRYSSDYINFWTYEPSFTYGNFQFNDLFFVQRAVNPDEFGNLIGLDSNAFYYTASAYYTNEMLVTGTLRLLQSMNGSGLTYGPYGNVAFSAGVDLLDNATGLIIAALDQSHCLNNVSVCATTGFSLSMWLKLTSSFIPYSTDCSPCVSSYILRSYFYSSNQGVEIVAQQGVMTVTVHDSNTAYSASFKLTNFVANHYANLAFTWMLFGDSYVISVYVNGTLINTNTTITSGNYASVTVRPLVIGSLSSEDIFTYFSVYNFAYWTTALSTLQVNLMLGMPSAKVSYVGSSDIYWVFSGEYYNLQQFTPQLYGGATLVSDRFSMNTAVQLTASSNSYVLLATKSQLTAAASCLVTPSVCEAFFFQFWAQLDNTTDGYIFSSGAEDVYTQGFAINQTTDIETVVSNNVTTTVQALFMIVTVRTTTRVYVAKFNVQSQVNLDF